MVVEFVQTQGNKDTLKKVVCDELSHYFRPVVTYRGRNNIDYAWVGGDFEIIIHPHAIAVHIMQYDPNPHRSLTAKRLLRRLVREFGVTPTENEKRAQVKSEVESWLGKAIIDD